MPRASASTSPPTSGCLQGRRRQGGPAGAHLVCRAAHHRCRISEALALTPEHVDLPGKAVVFETLKKRRRGVYRAVPVPPGLLDQLDLVHGLREALKRGRGHADRLLWPAAG